MTSKSLLEEVMQVSVQNSSSLETYFGNFSKEQLEWKPNSNTWSLNELFWHLNGYALYYNEVILRKIQKTRFNKQAISYSSSPLGKSAYESMKLGKQMNVKRKLRAQKSMDPVYNSDKVGSNEFQSFVLLHEEFKKIINLASTVSLRKVKIPITVSKLVRFRLGDILLFIAYHNQRHIQQGMNLTDLPNFPKA
jgi:hypothetical protein